eukprot:TRINITY_DN47987_c0_g1_i1.p1 TRINITY_DN47987_c0_g1~~TRINITY_DN47987_c0_g1_i1.p1  ORF type:complete len:258 (+),score=81.30 TRINITY_DN47987_c0_g1_i1:55-774(+)
MARCLVLGSTGATGGWAVRELAASSAVGSVTAFTRRDLSEAEVARLLHVESSETSLRSKVSLQRVDYDSGLTDQLFEGYDVVVCCLGTTKGDAGSNEGRFKVDHDYVVNSARHARASPTTRLFSLVTAQGADPKSSFHYNKTKGMAEDAVRQMQFPHLSIWRPGLLSRGDLARGVEKAGKCIGIPAIDVRVIGQAIAKDTEAVLAEPREASAAPQTVVRYNDETYVRAGVPKPGRCLVM